jgi:anti-sigma-K factor RskA
MSDIHALSGAYAVDALDDIERAQFERHLAECETCRAEVMSLQEASSLLAETTTVEPSAELRERVLTGISNVRPLPPEVPTQDDRGGDQGGDQSGDQSGAVTTLDSRRRRRVLPFLAAAAAVVAIGAGGIAYQQLNDEPQQDRFSAIAEAPDAQHFTVELGGGASATVYRSKKLNEAAIRTKDMPLAPAGKEYVLWLKHGSTMTPAGVMPPHADNRVVLSGDAASADGAAVSIEDAGSEPTQPSGEIAAAFSFA